jgi:lipid A 3-O-deacylase
MRALKILAAVAAASLTAAPALAADYITGYVGYFDVLDSNGDNATQFGAEYRMEAIRYGLRPTVGVNVSTDNSVYGYAGLNWDIPVIANQLYLIPNFMAGAYREGDGKDLGGAIQFRSGVELAYQFQNQHRLGVAFNHISNASIYDKNPGSETLLINYSIPTTVLR